MKGALKRAYETERMGFSDICVMPGTQIGEDYGKAPGDWTCPACGEENWQRRKECTFCNKAKPPQPDWKCPDCGFRNRDANAICGGKSGKLGCKNPRPGLEEARVRQDKAGSRKKKRSEYICCMWAQDKCRYGDTCKHLHEDDGKAWCSFKENCTYEPHKQRVEQCYAIEAERQCGSVGDTSTAKAAIQAQLYGSNGGYGEVDMDLGVDPLAEGNPPTAQAWDAAGAGGGDNIPSAQSWDTLAAQQQWAQPAAAGQAQPAAQQSVSETCTF